MPNIFNVNIIDKWLYIVRFKISKIESLSIAGIRVWYKSSSWFGE